MNKTTFKKIGMLSLFCVALSTFALQLPVICYGAEYSLFIDPSPNIINIASERNGEIRFFTEMKYSFFTSNGGEAFIYFNDSESIENIRATRDSLGNLILKFNLEDLLALGSSVIPDFFNNVAVVITIHNGDEYTGQEEIYIVDKKAP